MATIDTHAHGYIVKNAAGTVIYSGDRSDRAWARYDAELQQEVWFLEALNDDISHLVSASLPATAFCDEHYAEMARDDMMGRL